MEVSAMRRRCCSLVGFAASLLALLSSSGCTSCQNCDDYCGSYYGGRNGDWVHETSRAGSIHGPRTVSVGASDETVEPMVEAPADDYYP
jgi:hypothetical protein